MLDTQNPSCILLGLYELTFKTYHALLMICPRMLNCLVACKVVYKILSVYVHVVNKCKNQTLYATCMGIFSVLYESKWLRLVAGVAPSDVTKHASLIANRGCGSCRTTTRWWRWWVDWRTARWPDSPRLVPAYRHTRKRYGTPVWC